MSQAEDDTAPLLCFLQSLPNPASPTEPERRLLWIRAFEWLQERIEAGLSERQTKSMALDFLHRHAPCLAASKDALRKTFERKFARWLEAEGNAKALRDGRRQPGEQQKLGDTDRDKLIAHAVFNCGGRVSQAWRELCDRNELSEPLLSSLVGNPASKSYVPHSIRREVQAEVRRLYDIHHGPRQHKLNGAFISRDWSGVKSGDWYQADDTTAPLYFFTENSTGGFSLMRGQLLLMIDLRSTRILSYVLISERSYTARAIRTLITRTCDEHGLPRKGFYFERGIWESSKLLKGDAAADPLSLDEVELGLRELGLRFVHSNLPRSKPVERVIGALQNLMEGLPGYVGRNEMVEKFERVQQHKREVESGKAQPSQHFLSEAEWLQTLDRLCEGYNQTRQDGKMTGGFSPEDAFARFDDAGDPPTRLDASCRYLLAHHKRPMRVTRNGITLPQSFGGFTYRNAQTGRLAGQMVLVFFNPELPEIITVTDMERRNPFSVAARNSVPAMDAPEEALAAELANIESHQRYARERYRVLKLKYQRPFRRNVVAARVTELGESIREQTAAAQVELRRAEQLQRKARRVAQQTGLPADRFRRPEQVEAAEELARLLPQREGASTP